MSDIPANRPDAAASGTLSKTPAIHLLLYCLEKRLSGTVEFTGAGGAGEPVAWVLFVRGKPAKARTSENVSHLGRVLLELGYLSNEQLTESLTALAQAKRTGPALHGQLLLAAGVIDIDMLHAGLAEQMARSFRFIAALPGEAQYAYYDGFDGLAGWGVEAAELGFDPIPMIWSMLRENPPQGHVSAALERVIGSRIRLTREANVARLGLAEEPRGVVDRLVDRPMRVSDILVASRLGEAETRLLVYLLLVTKQVNLLRANDSPLKLRTALPSSASKLRAAPPSSSMPPARAESMGSMSAMPAISPLTSTPSEGTSQPAGARTPSEGTSQPAGGARPSQGMPRAPGGATPSQGALRAAAGATPSQGMPSAGGAPTPSQGMPGARGVSVPSQEMPRSATPTQGMRRVSTLTAAAKASSPSSRPPVNLSQEHAERWTEIVERAATIDRADYFAMLDIPRDASLEEVEAAFFTLAKRWHPDRLPAELAPIRAQCSRVFARMSEAHATLSDSELRTQYMGLLAEGSGSPDVRETVLKVVEAATDFQKAEVCLRRSDYAQAETLCRKALDADPTQPDYLAMVAWLLSLKPENQTPEKTKESIAMLDRAIAMSGRSEKAYFWRGMLNKRLGKPEVAFRDFKTASELNPRNIDAAREVRLHRMRRGPRSSSPPPPGPGRTVPPPGSGRPRPNSVKPEEPKPSLLGRFFKKT